MKIIFEGSTTRSDESTPTPTKEVNKIKQLNVSGSEESGSTQPFIVKKRR